MTQNRNIDQASPELLRQLRALDSCTVSNAIERLNVRARNEGFTNQSIRCLSPALPPMVGYAAPGRMRSAGSPTTRHWYYTHMDWWAYLLTIPAPRVIVLQDVDDPPGLGAAFGEIHANIGRVLGCIGYLSNGTVRDLPAVARTKFHVFASGLSVSHAYAHVVDFGEPVEIGGMPVKPGDLLHGDMHGVVSVPLPVAEDIPAAAAALLAEERELIELCQSPGVSLDELQAHIRGTGAR
jgi:4-hydroxy-4-methyl-2-oxoglutarate aldolase